MLSIASAYLLSGGIVQPKEVLKMGNDLVRRVLWGVMLGLLLCPLMPAREERGVDVIPRLPKELEGEHPYRTSWALLIGINRYHHLPPLSYAVQDVEAVKRLLIDRFGFPPNHIITLCDEQATKEAIEEALSSLTDSDRVQVDDRVLVYFSGHGQTVSLPERGEMGFLVPVDAKVRLDQPRFLDYNPTCLPMDDLKRISMAIPAKHVLFLVDACYSGLAVTRGRGIEPNIPDYLSKVAKARVQQVIAAGRKGEKAIEKPIWGHGAFTYKLLPALRYNLADSQNGDGVVTGEELAVYLQTAVARLTGGGQNPQFGYFRDWEGQFLFVPDRYFPERLRSLAEEGKLTPSEVKRAQELLNRVFQGKPLTEEEQRRLRQMQKLLTGQIPGKGTLYLNARPWAVVYLDGEKVGETPLTLREVEAGPHTVEFHYGVQIKIKKVKVTPGEPVSVSVNFERERD